MGSVGGAGEETEGASGTPWSEFTRSKHAPGVDEDVEGDELVDQLTTQEVTPEPAARPDDEYQAVTPVSPGLSLDVDSKFVPVPPQDFEIPTHPYRDAAQMSQNRLPFMTPIVEKTESSFHIPSEDRERDYFNSKTPCRRRVDDPAVPNLENLLRSPLQEIINEAAVERGEQRTTNNKKKARSTEAGSSTEQSREPIIKDLHCNPVDETIRQTILDAAHPSHQLYRLPRPPACLLRPQR